MGTETHHENQQDTLNYFLYAHKSQKICLEKARHPATVWYLEIDFLSETARESHHVSTDLSGMWKYSVYSAKPILWKCS